jgi:hypothetical protein
MTSRAAKMLEPPSPDFYGEGYSFSYALATAARADSLGTLLTS